MNQPLLCPQHPQEPVVAACARCGDFGCRYCVPPHVRVCLRCNPTGADPLAKPDLGKAMSWAFQDPRWLSKVLLGAGCLIMSILVVPQFFLFGYALRVSRREREAPRQELPEWEDLGGLFADGFKWWLTLVLPMLAIFVTLGVLLGGTALVVAATQGQQGQQAAAAVAVIGMVAFYVGLFPLMLAYAYAQPALQLQYLRTGSVTAGFHLRALWKIIADRPGDYFMLSLSCFLTKIIANFVGQFLCLIGIFATFPWALYTDAWLVGRYWAWLDAQEGYRYEGS